MQCIIRYCKSALPSSACRKRVMDLRKKNAVASANKDVARGRLKRNLWKQKVGLWQGALYRKL